VPALGGGGGHYCVMRRWANPGEERVDGVGAVVVAVMRVAASSKACGHVMERVWEGSAWSGRWSRSLTLLFEGSLSVLGGGCGAYVGARDRGRACEWF